MKCRDCKWMYTNETMGGLHICVNWNSQVFGGFTGVRCEDDCPDGESDGDEDNEQINRGR